MFQLGYLKRCLNKEKIIPMLVIIISENVRVRLIMPFRYLYNQRWTTICFWTFFYLMLKCNGCKCICFILCTQRQSIYYQNTSTNQLTYKTQLKIINHCPYNIIYAVALCCFNPLELDGNNKHASHKIKPFASDCHITNPLTGLLSS